MAILCLLFYGWKGPGEFNAFPQQSDTLQACTTHRSSLAFPTGSSVFSVNAYLRSVEKSLQTDVNSLGICSLIPAQELYTFTLSLQIFVNCKFFLASCTVVLPFCHAQIWVGSTSLPLNWRQTGYSVASAHWGFEEQ